MEQRSVIEHTVPWDHPQPGSDTEKSPRLDAYCALHFGVEALSGDVHVNRSTAPTRPTRKLAAKAIKRGDVLVNGKRGSTSQYLRGSDIIAVLGSQRSTVSELQVPAQTPIHPNEAVSYPLAEGDRDDRDFVLSAVRLAGCSLQYASKHLRADRLVVLTAVTQNGNALEFADILLRADEDIVRQAVLSDGTALQWASRALRNNQSLILEALSQDPEALKYVSQELQADSEFLLQIAADVAAFRRGFNRDAIARGETLTL